MDDIVISLVIAATKKRIEDGKVPTDITLGVLIRDIKDSLNRLHKQGKIKVGDTINDKYIKIL